MATYSAPANRQQRPVRLRHRIGYWFRCFGIGFFSLLIGGTLSLLIPGTAFAHAEYVSSDPASEAMITKAPTTVTIHFSENVDPTGSNVLIYDVDGKQVSTGTATVDRTDLKTMAVNMTGDNAEVYVVYWHTVSAVEGHHDAGSFRFFVNISPMLKSMVSGTMSGSPMSSGSSMSSSATNTMSSTTSSAGTPTWLTALIGLIGLVVGGGVVFVVTRPSTAATKKEE